MELLSPNGLCLLGSVGELIVGQILPKWQLVFPGLKVGGPRSHLLGPLSLSGWSLFWFRVLNTLMIPSAKKLHLQWDGSAFSHWPRHAASFKESGQWDGLYLRRPEQERCLWRHLVNLETELDWDNACFPLLFACLFLSIFSVRLSHPLLSPCGCIMKWISLWLKITLETFCS